MTTPHPEVPGYSIVDLVGRGGFAVVYRATQVTIDREVAVKIDSRMILDDRDRRRFLREARAAGRLSGHPNVVDLYDAGVLPDGRPYLVMELCTNSLLDRLQRSGPMPWGKACTLGAQVADALAAAHEAGVLHRDIKPANILVNRYGVYGLADFGLASLVEPGRENTTNLIALTPAYAPPEAFRQDEPLTEHADIYALGATIYALMHGRPPRFPPVGDPSLAEIIRLHEQPLPGIPGVPDEVVNVLATAMAIDPSDRHATAADFRDALAALPSHEHVPDPEATPEATELLGFGPQRDEATTVGRIPSATADSSDQESDAEATESVPPARRGRSRLFSKSGRVALILLSVAIMTTVGVSWAVLASLNDGVQSSDMLDVPNSPDSADGATDILLVGNDSRTDTNGRPLPDDVLKVLRTEQKPGTNTDTLIVARIPNDGRPASVVSIPSAIRVSLPDDTTTTMDHVFATGKRKAETELRASGVTDSAQLARDSDTAGRRLLVQVTQHLTGVRLDHYGELNLYGFYLVSDAIGGVDICLNAAVVDSDSGANFPAGSQTIAGADALSFVRQRNGLPRGELDRIARQQAFLSATLDKILSAGTLTNPTAVGELVETLSATMVIDDKWDILDFARQMHDLTTDDVRFVTIPTVNDRVDPAHIRSFMTGLVANAKPDSARRDDRPAPAPPITSACVN